MGASVVNNPQNFSNMEMSIGINSILRSAGVTNNINSQKPHPMPPRQISFKMK
jgi:hypothetical protein